MMAGHTAGEERAIQFRQCEPRMVRNAQAISPEILLYLNVSVFAELRSRGTSKARTCAVLDLSGDEYDYVDAMV